MLDQLPLLNTLAASGESFESQIDAVLPIVAIGVGGLIAIVAIVFTMLTSIVRSRESESSRREIAAYVAEGSITADEAQRLMETEIKES